MASEVGPMTGKVLNGRYRIGDRIGMGGMAEVYMATDETLGRTVAVKVMLPQYADDPDFARRFRQEAAAAANLQSPYIVNVYDWGHEGNVYYIVMEYVRGSDLKTAIQERGAINQRKVAEIGMQVCQALAVAHAQDIMHRDIKPQNIMIQPDGNVKVMDFGIARAKNSQTDKTQTVLGTAHYISPEQAQGKDLNASSDIYSLGIVLYEAATGTLPFDGPDAVSVALMQVKDFPPDMREINPDISPEFDSIVMTALDKEPGRRFATANDMRKALGDYLSGRAVARNDFTSAHTNVIAPIGAAGAPNAGGIGTTQIMQPVPGANADAGNTAGKPGMTGTRNYRSNNEPQKSNKKVVIGIVAAVAAIAVIAAVLFAFLGGGEKVTVPNVVGMTMEKATASIEAAGLTVGKTDSVYDESVPAGSVVSQNPNANTEATKGSKVNLVVSQGTEQVSVPNVVGMSLTEATNALAKAGLIVGDTKEDYSDSVEAGKVSAQSPAANQQAPKGSKINLTISKGADKATVPDIEGLSIEAAQARAQSAGLSISQSGSDYSDSVPANCIISQSPSAGSKLDRNSSISYVVSLGPRPSENVSVPSLIGLSEAGARSTLQNAGLGADVSYASSASVARGNVISQNVSAGVSVAKGTSIGIVISTGSGGEPN